MNTTATPKTKRCPECSGAGTQLYGLMGDVARTTCAKCHGAGRLTVKPRAAKARATRAANQRMWREARIAERARSLATAVEELQQAIRWRDIARRENRPAIQRALLGAMRRHALDSRLAFAGELLCAGADYRLTGDLPLAKIFTARRAA